MKCLKFNVGSAPVIANVMWLAELFAEVGVAELKSTAYFDAIRQRTD